MPVFVFIVREEVEKVRERIEALPAESTYALTDDSWLVSYFGTTKACAEKLGIREDAGVPGASGIAFPVSNYAGRFTTDVWEWPGLHMARGEV
jgi:hypothetical protein